MGGFFVRVQFIAIILFNCFCAQLKSQSVLPKSYNIVWETPSKDALGSMPLSGRKGAGANVWVQDSSVWIYLSHNGAYDEQGRLLKLGCLRITPRGITLGGSGFKQTLDIATGTIQISQGDFNMSLWFAGETLIYEALAKQPVIMKVAYGSWREKQKDSLRLDMGRITNVSADSIKSLKNTLLFYHRNEDFSVDIIKKGSSQGIPADAVYDATTKRIFGGVLCFDNAVGMPSTEEVQWQNWKGKAWLYTNTKSKKHVVTVHLGGSLFADTKQWERQASSLLSETNRKKAKEHELKYWKEFWNRSHVFINADKSLDDTAFAIGRNYQLFRYMLACNREGELPLLFNGGIFTVDNIPGGITGNNNDALPIYQKGESTPDFRRWMYCSFMSQNQRWLGWPAIANGDIDLLSPSLSFYRNRSKTAAARARTNNAGGVVYPEPLDIWGLCSSGVAPRPDGLTNLPHLKYHFSMMIEHAWMALQAHSQLGIPIKGDLDWLEGVVFFYDSFYRKQYRSRTGQELNDSGKLVIYPACGLEFAGGATNPIEVVSGLTRITDALLTLDEVNAADKKELLRVRASLPPLPEGVRNGTQSLLPAATWEKEYNLSEPIEMYAYWPYRMVGVTKPATLSLARNTWLTISDNRAKFCKQDYSWMANVVNMAALGWPDSAQKRATYKLSNMIAPQARFPAFFGPGHDWLPDHNWGGSGIVGVQEMLMAADPYGDGKIYLLPAWPKEWDVDFKLCAPQQTIVEATVRNGKIVSLNVSPKSREKDVIVDAGFR
ncbi:DUF5703 domain-containing protein [Chitinophagaceae bacterium 26-R-25]|nr:DUF5703 domain-containing protein [Chitinophagaceae bacterium 26-R-25]